MCLLGKYCGFNTLGPISVIINKSRRVLISALPIILQKIQNGFYQNQNVTNSLIIGFCFKSVEFMISVVWLITVLFSYVIKGLHILKYCMFVQQRYCKCLSSMQGV